MWFTARKKHADTCNCIATTRINSNWKIVEIGKCVVNNLNLASNQASNRKKLFNCKIAV